jgi:hypothetical protein
MYISFDSISIIANNEDNRVQFMSDHGADFLGRQLECSIAGEQDRSSIAGLLASECRAFTCTCCIANASPQDLADFHDTFREVSFEDAIVTGTSLGQEDVVFLQPLAHSRLEPFVCDGGTVGCLFLVRDHVARHGRTIHDAQFGQFVDELAEYAPYTNAWIF